MKPKKVIKQDIMIIDPLFPPNSYKGFRASIIHELFNAYPNAKSYHYPRKYPPLKDKNTPPLKLLLSYTKQFVKLFLGYTKIASYSTKGNIFEYKLGFTRKRFEKIKDAYRSPFPEHRERIEFLDDKARYEAKLAFLIFVNVTNSLLHFLERNQIPFVFIMFPGGGFRINQKIADDKIRRICKSAFFKKVIVTNKLAQDYLIEKKFCRPECIHLFISKGKFTETENLKPKQCYPKDKSSFDLAFVAYKYMPKGLDKGYDLFIEAAKLLAKKYDAMRFHVVGSFDEKEIDVTEIREKIIFYGRRDTEFLIDFYSRMDIFISPNRPFVLSKGSFDGFPLGGHAQFCGVALFVTDELKLNNRYKDDEIVIIKPEVHDILSKIEFYYSNLDTLYELSRMGQQKIHNLGSNDRRKKELQEIIDPLL
jgi:glycosyltransferase involved in cell wall biosynthesis